MSAGRVGYTAVVGPVRAALLVVVAVGVAVGLGVAATGCTERIQLGVEDAGPGLPGLVELRLSPPSSTIDLPDSTPRAVQLTATGVFSGGEERDVTTLVEWSVDNPYPGALDAPGHWLTSGQAGGVVVITARSGPVAGTAEVRVILSRTIDDSLFPPPAGAADLFEGAVSVDDPTRAPVVRYPETATTIPPDLARMLFQYAAGVGNDVWRLRFDSEFLHLVVLTGATRWQADAEVWSWIARTNVGGAFVLEVAGGAVGAPGTVYPAPPLLLQVAATPIAQAVYFWSAETVWRAQVSDGAAIPFYATPADGTCVGCHALSRDGRRMAVGYGGETLQVVDVPGRNVLVGADRGYAMGWATFSPDGAQVLVADKGKLQLVDVATGAGTPIALPPGVLATHPDWSPDGAAIAVAIGGPVGNKDMKGGRIARLPYAGGLLGPPEVLVEATGAEDNNFFPRWSPDGRVIAYVHADGASRGAVTAEIRLVAADGGAPVVAARLNGVADSGNHFPAWAPSATPGRAWLAFASQRMYGEVLPAGVHDQVWVSAIDLDRVATGEDPSSAPFWLPAQNPTERTDGPFWAPLPVLEAPRSDR